MFTKIRSLIVPDIGIDLGSSNTRVCVVGRGIVLELPSALAINIQTNRLVEVGEKAKEYLDAERGMSWLWALSRMGKSSIFTTRQHSFVIVSRRSVRGIGGERF